MNNTLVTDQTSSATETYDISPQNADAWYALGNSHWAQGDIDKAGECCRHAIALRPDHFEANIILANILFSQSKLNEALVQYQKAIDINATHPVAHCNLGNIYSIMGRHADAAASYQTAIKLDPNLFIAFYNLGNLRFQQGMYDKAVNNFIRAIALNPDPEQLNLIKQQGVLLIQHNHLHEAKALYMQLCRTYPEDARVWLRLSTINGKLGDMEEAGDCCRRVLAIDPRCAQAHVVLGNVFFHHRQIDDAREHYRNALQLNPHNVTALNNFGNTCQSEDQINDYLAFYRRAIEGLPDPSPARAVFSKVIRNALPTQYEPWLDRELQAFFSLNSFDDKFLSRVTARLLRLKYDVQAASEKNSADWSAISDIIATDRLFTLYLEQTVNADPDLERFIKGLRRELLTAHCSGKPPADEELRIVTAIAQQCFNNEYVLALDSEERQIIADLRHSLEQNIPGTTIPDRSLESALLVFAMYENPYSLTCRDHLAGLPATSWSEAFGGFLKQTVLNPIEEEAIKREIPMIGSIQDETSRLVQSQYEENPYPRWLSVPEDKPRDLKPLITQLFPHFTPPSFLDGPIKILIAGCGTGKHPIQNSYYNNVEITAIDMSRSSLAYATRMARQYGVTNVEFVQADILELDKLDQRFHIIESVGVLHHMEDPMAGWRILTDLLVDGGLMSVGLYSELARQAVVAARAIIRREGLAPNQRNIREFRNRVLRHELNDGLSVLRNYNDFYSSSECRDLLFHTTEHRYTLPRIGQAIAELDLDFLGFVFDNMKAPGMYRELFPADGEMKDLHQWDRFEQAYPNTFIGMYKFWCQKNGRHGH